LGWDDGGVWRGVVERSGREDGERRGLGEARFGRGEVWERELLPSTKDDGDVD